MYMPRSLAQLSFAQLMYPELSLQLISKGRPRLD
jgi:hypothetical protein